MRGLGADYIIYNTSPGTLSFYLSIKQTIIYVSAFLSIYLSIYLYIYLSIYQYIYPGMRTGRSEDPSCRSLSLLWKERKEKLVRKLQLLLCRWIYLLWAQEPDEPLKLRMLCSTLRRKLCSILNLRMFTGWDQGLN